MPSTSKPPAFFRALDLRKERASVEDIEKQIRLLRGHPVLLDTDLATLCGVTPRRLLDQVSRHEPLAGEFCFAPDREELAPHGVANPRRTPLRYAFTEHGAFMAAIFLRTPEAIAMSVQIVRAFIRYREQGVSHVTLTRRLVGNLGTYPVTTVAGEGTRPPSKERELEARCPHRASGSV